MDNSEVTEKVNMIVGTWKETQKIKIIEELSELITALIHYDNNKIKKEELISEVADVEIMLLQLRILYDIKNDDIEKEKLFKLRRTVNIINSEK